MGDGNLKLIAAGMEQHENMQVSRFHLKFAGTGRPLPNSRSPTEEVYLDHHPGIEKNLEGVVWGSDCLF